MPGLWQGQSKGCEWDTIGCKSVCCTFPSLGKGDCLLRERRLPPFSSYVSLLYIISMQTLFGGLTLWQALGARHIVRPISWCFALFLWLFPFLISLLRINLIILLPSQTVWSFKVQIFHNISLFSFTWPPHIDPLCTFLAGCPIPTK